MLRWIIRTSLRLRFLVALGAAMLIFFGVTQIRNMPVDVFPDFSPPKVEVQVLCLGLSAAEVEELVTVPMEQLLNGLPGLDVLRSKSIADLSDIVLIFKPGTNLFDARLRVQERVREATVVLPIWATSPFMLQPLSSTSRVMKIGLSTKDKSTQNLIDTALIAYWTIRPRLMRVPGVANVAIWGDRWGVMQVQVDPERLKEKEVSLLSVMEASSDALDTGMLKFRTGFMIGTGGFIDTPNQRLGVRHILPKLTPDELAKLPLEVPRGGKPVALGDVARIVRDTQPHMNGDAIIDDGLGVMMIVEKLPWGNTLEITRGVEQALAEMQPGLPGIKIDSTIFRPATFIEASISNLTWAMFIGAFLLVLVLVVFLYDWRVASISVVAIPLSLTAALLVLYWFGTTINTMILAGFVIALGAVVDDAIVDVENIVRRLRQHRGARSETSTAQVILEASLEVRGAIVFATLIIVLAVVPVFFLEGLAGAFFQPLALAYALALLASLAVALTITPALCLILLAGAPLRRREPPLARWLKRHYHAVLAGVLGSPRPAYLSVAASALLGLALLPFLGSELLPAFKERDFLIQWEGAPGTSHPEMSRITAQASSELRSLPGVRSVSAHVGRAVLGDQVIGINAGQLWVGIDRSADREATAAAIQQTVAGYPGLVREVQTYLQGRIREVLAGSSEAIVVRIYGPDLAVLRATAEELRSALTGIEGVADLQVETAVEEPQVQIEVNLAAAARYGLKPGDVRRAAAVLVGGLEVGSLFEEQKVFEVVVWAQPAARHSLTSIRELQIDTPGGGHVPLGEVADVRVAATPALIKHEANSRRIDVSLNVRGRDLGAVAAEVERRLKGVPFPLEYHPQLLGEHVERQAAQQRLLIAGLAAVIGIFLLLQASFASWRLAALAFTALPTALVGGVLAAGLASGGVISLGSLVGFLAVLGIAARNGILLINHYQHLERSEGEPFGRGLVLRGAGERLTPILMTALTTALALVPLVVAGNIPGHEIEHPMAIVILGGLVSSTLLNLLVLPALYLRLGRDRTLDRQGSQGA